MEVKRYRVVRETGRAGSILGHGHGEEFDHPETEQIKQLVWGGGLVEVSSKKSGKGKDADKR